MPYENKGQQRFLYKKHPKVAKKFTEDTYDYENLPEKKKNNKRSPWLDMNKKETK